MKKCLALILMLCLLATSALAHQDCAVLQVVGETTATLVCVSERENLEDAALAALLENALKNLPENPDAVPTDLFHATVEGETTITFQSDAVAAYFTKDGAQWTNLNALCEGGKVTVTLAESGVVLFAELPGEGDAALTPDVNAPVPETSVNFTPSVSGKLAPEVVISGEHAAVILDAAGNEVAGVPFAKLVVTPLSLRAQCDDIAVYEHLEWAYNSVLEGTDPVFEGLVVSDLFSVAVYGEYWNQLNVEGNVMKVTFAAEAANLTVLCSDELGAWHVVPAENVVVNANGTVTLTLEHAGVLAFAVEAADAVNGTVTAP